MFLPHVNIPSRVKVGVKLSTKSVASFCDSGICNDAVKHAVGKRHTTKPLFFQLMVITGLLLVSNANIVLAAPAMEAPKPLLIKKPQNSKESWASKGGGLR